MHIIDYMYIHVVVHHHIGISLLLLKMFIILIISVLHVCTHHQDRSSSTVSVPEEVDDKISS
jgi:hypothetical protein